MRRAVSVRDAFVSAAAIEFRNALCVGPSLSPTLAGAFAALITYRVGAAAARSKGVGDRVGAPAFTPVQMTRIRAIYR